MRDTKIAIIGAGVSGLYAAYLLEHYGFKNYMLLEASESFGGRIATIPSPKKYVGYDLGATWYWPSIQTQLAHVVSSLGLEIFPQPLEGDMLFERSPYGAPQRMSGYTESAPSMRIVGGMGALTSALIKRLDAAKLHAGTIVRQCKLDSETIEIEVNDSRGTTRKYEFDYVLLAIPPRLSALNMIFRPSLPEYLINDWVRTATWMAPYAKYLAIYKEPFWRKSGLSGEARSSAGPLNEIHDASLYGSEEGALFGFVAVPASVRQQNSPEVLKILCRLQLARLFGEQAASPRFDMIKDWASEPHTATSLDLVAEAAHHHNAPMTPHSGAWRNRIFGIASEFSPIFPGYVAGAVDAAERGVNALKYEITSSTCVSIA